jgi:four helix bundle protein
MSLKYKKWIRDIPEEITNDSLWRMKVYRYALFLSDVVWKDVQQLSKNKLLMSSCAQIFRSAGSVSANISEGYSKKSRRDRARFYEYALGSARETRGWYYKIRHNLDEDTLHSRLKLIAEIIKMLLYIIPLKRGQKIREPGINYADSESFNDEPIENIDY